MGQTRRQPKSGIPKSALQRAAADPGPAPAHHRAAHQRRTGALLIQAKEQVQQALEERRQATREIASASQAWVEQQTQLRRDIETLLAEVEPQRSEQIRLQERLNQLEQQIQAQRQGLAELDAESPSGGESSQDLTQQLAQAEADIQALAGQITETEAALNCPPRDPDPFD